MHRGTPLCRATVAGVTVALLGAAAASADAATIATNAPCYLTGSPLTIAGQGFTPGATVTIESQGLFSAPVADAAGSFSAASTAPTLPFTRPGVKTYTLNAGDGTNTASTKIRVTSFKAQHRPRVPSKPQSNVRWRVSGLRPGARVYAHYVHGGKQQRRVSFGRMPKRCGVLEKRLRMIPIAHPATGKWRIQIDTRKRYSAKTKPKFVERGTVTRRIVG
jgi:hypothetical protein